MQFRKTWFVAALTLTAMYGQLNFVYAQSSSTQTPGTSQTSNLTQNQAIQIATQFCQNAGGFTLAPNVEAHFPSVSGTIQWTPSWSVRFMDQAFVEIDDARGAVTYYTGPQVAQFVPAGQPISQTDAIAKALSVLQAAGITDVDPTPYAKPPQETAYTSQDGGTTILPSASGHEWIVVYQRMFGQIPYSGQSVIVNLQAETGILNTFNVYYTSSPPVNAVSLTDEQASTAAWNLVNNTTIQNAVLKGTALFAVRPNRFFISTDHSEEALSGPARLAYVCSFAYQGVDSPRHSVNNDPSLTEPDDWLNFGQSEANLAVFVDAQDGSIVGGWLSQSRGIVKPVATAVADAREIQVIAKNKRGEWMDKKPIALLSEAANTKMFHQVKTLQSFAPHKQIKREKQAAVLKVVLFDKAGDAKQEIFYMSTGKIGKPSAEATPSPALKTWLQSLPKIALQETATVSVSRK